MRANLNGDGDAEQRIKSYDDGRNISAELGTLTGEASGQKTQSANYNVALQSKSYPYIPSKQDQSAPSYYDTPLLKQPVWIWSIATYFYVGGVTGVSSALGAVVQLTAPKTMGGLVTKARWIGTLGGAVSAALLIHDLGRPERFLNMLRVFRPSSPMSMGSWILTVFSTAAGAAAVLPYGPKIFRPLASVFGLISGVFGLGLSGYTGVLISQTAVPLWQHSYRTMPVLFLASGTAAAASFLELFDLNEQETVTVERFGLMGKVLELGVSMALEADAKRIERVGRPLQGGLSGTLWQTAKVLTIAATLVSLMPGKSRAKRITSGILGSLASLSLRFGIYYGGKASARDPRATFDAQRQVEPPTASLSTGLAHQQM